MDYKKIFEALPHINVIWVKDENFHLHPNYGGEKIERESLSESKPKGRPKKEVEESEN